MNDFLKRINNNVDLWKDSTGRQKIPFVKLDFIGLPYIYFILFNRYQYMKEK